MNCVTNTATIKPSDQHLTTIIKESRNMATQPPIIQYYCLHLSEN